MDKAHKNISNFISFILILIIANVTFAQSVNDNEPEKYLVDSLLKNHIVMLGEVHNQPILHNVLINTLKIWIEESSKSSEPSNLTLILETDSIFTLKLEDKSFPIDSIITLIQPYDYLENLEFYTNLKSLCFTIDSINVSRKSKIELKIKGFESDEYPTKNSGREMDLWFVNQRDSLSGYSIIRYIKQHPTENILIYYGAAHLIKNYVSKESLAPSLNYDESKGYFLAHYLAKAFGDNNVITVLLCTSMNDTVFAEYFIGSNHSKALVKRNDVTEKVFGFISERYIGDYDYYLFLSGTYMSNHQLCLIFSKVIIEKLQVFIQNLEEFEKTNKARQSYFLTRLFIISGKWFKTSNEINNWLLNTQYDGLKQLSSDFLKIQLITGLQFNAENSDFRNILNQLGFDDSIITSNFIPDSLQWCNFVWPDNIKQIKFLNCIGIYWIGDEFEKTEAKNYLLEYCGIDYANPIDYFIWYRHKIGLNY